MVMRSSVEVAIVGAGPYGLSIAAHLLAKGISTRVFGSPMSVWREHMPNGMLLKSVGMAVNLYEPSSRFTFKGYCQRAGIPYHDTAIPVRLDTFLEYAAEFQQRFVPALDEVEVLAIERSSDGFLLVLSNGEHAWARRVVLATGISHFAYVPPQLSHLPAEFVTHSSAHKDVRHFRGQRVIIVGGGASAMDLAALLSDVGADVTVVARRTDIRFTTQRSIIERPLLSRLRRPESNLGQGWKLRVFADAPALFHRLPESVRLRIVRNYLGPTAGWTVKDRVLGHVPLLLRTHTRAARVRDGKVEVDVATEDGMTRTLVADHVIAASGYRVDLRRLTFLSEDVRGQIRSIEHTPILSAGFESSVPGLYFVGCAAANSFGPVLRFVCGAQFTARTVAAHVARSASSRSPQVMRPRDSSADSSTTMATTR